MHILYLIDEIKVRGGTEKHLLSLAMGMAQYGHQVSVYCLQDGDFTNSFKALKEDIVFSCLNIKKIYDFNGLKGIIKLSSIIANQKVDLIQTFHTGSDIIGPIAAKLSRTQVIIISSRRDLGFTKNLRHLKIQRFINKWVDCVFANSLAVKKAILNQENYPESKIKVIYNGIIQSTAHITLATSNKFREKFNIPNNAIVIGTIGNLTKVKGYHILIDVASSICAEHQNIYFFVAGDGILRETLTQKVISLNIQNKFFFLGNIDNVSLFLSEIDIYMHLSLSEGFSNAILEAMDAGLPVISTSVGGNTEIIKNGFNGYLSAPQDISGTCKSTNLLIESLSIRKKMGKLNKEIVNTKFSMEGMLNNYFEIYQDIVKQKC